MKTPILGALTATLLLTQLPAFAQGTAFTYQGRLNAGGAAANGNYDLAFKLYGAGTGGTALYGPVTNTAVAVTNGLFTTLVDFGAVFTGSSNWLELAVSTNAANTFYTLAPRQQLTPVPCAEYAESSAGFLGALPSSQLTGEYGSLVAFDNPEDYFDGDGAGLTDLDASQLNGTVPDSALYNAWQTTGNSGTTTGVNFLGTTDNTPLEFWVNAARAFRLEPNTNGAPNVIGGSPVNHVAAGVNGAVIGGGGATIYYNFPRTNYIASDFGVIAGGLENFIDLNSIYSVIGGGDYNLIQTNANYSTVAGGIDAKIEPGASCATVGGGTGNIVTTNSTYGTIAGGYDNYAGAYSSVGGGLQNSATNYCAVVPGGYKNYAGGPESFAAGFEAQAPYGGDFVWSDGLNGVPFAATQPNQFLIQSAWLGINLTNRFEQTDFLTVNCPVTGQTAGVTVNTTGINSVPYYGYAVAGTELAQMEVDSGDTNKWKLALSGVPRLTVAQNGYVGVGTNNPAYPLELASGAYCSAAGMWTSVSDRNVKDNFAPINPRDVLARVAAMPITQWKYKMEPSGIKHLGPVAQDFHSAFGLGDSDRAIGTVDETGVALAAIQGLNEELQDKDAALRDLQQQNKTLGQRLARLEQLMDAKNGGGQ